MQAVQDAMKLMEQHQNIIIKDLNTQVIFLKETCDKLRTQRKEAIAARDSVAIERDMLAVERDLIAVERNQLLDKKRVISLKIPGKKGRKPHCMAYKCKNHVRIKGTLCDPCELK